MGHLEGNFTPVLYLDARFLKVNTLRQQTALKQQQSAADNARLSVFLLTLIEILLPSSPRHQFIYNEVRRISKYGLRKIRTR